MNRKLIRPNLSDVKSKEREFQPSPAVREQPQPPQRSAASNNNGNPTATYRPSPPAATSAPSKSAVASSDSNDGLSAGKATRRAPSAETNAEIYYYKKQIDTHTVMVIVLQDNEEIEGTIEWYDRNALKVNRKDAPNIMLLKHNIKYMYKAEDRIS